MATATQVHATDDLARERAQLRAELDWFLTTVIPGAFADIAVLVQDAHDAISPSPGGGLAGDPTDPTSASAVEYTLPVSSDLNDAVSVKGLVCIQGYTLTRSDVTAKFPSRSGAPVRVVLGPVPLNPVMEAHHHAAAVLALLQSTLPPFTYHLVDALTRRLAAAMESALAHVHHGHWTVGPAQSLVVPGDPQVAATAAIAGDHLVLGLAHVVPTTATPSTVALGSVSASPSTTGLAAAAGQKVSAAWRELQHSGRHHHARTASIGSAKAVPASGAATPPPPPSLNPFASSASGSSSPIPGGGSNGNANAKLRASASIRSALSGMGVGPGAPSATGSADRGLVWLHGRWHEVVSEVSVEVGWKQLVAFRNAVAAALALNNHLRAQMGVFARVAE
ncbi:hypothetical protein H9P43_004779 [Blastocladiella emersonii ATCC 22665]|nr:hypothetical protein H9P43_004779 [Blastocladiella emersonii ATCC 22665]